jgi:hypothetical protein
VDAAQRPHGQQTASAGEGGGEGGRREGRECMRLCERPCPRGRVVAYVQTQLSARTRSGVRADGFLPCPRTVKPVRG